MDAIWPSADITPALLELGDFLRKVESPLSSAQAVALAIRSWIDMERQGSGHRADASSAGAPARGYQWKCLFLPDGTALRMTYNEQNFFAHVERDAIMYQRRPVSPRQFTLAIAGDGRNAWRDLWIRFPGGESWMRAMLLRRRIERRDARQPVSPLDAMRQAAASMSETLKNALALVDHTNQLALPKYERRLTRARRADDVSSDICRLD
ncbi:MAG: hypothetical protein ACJ8LG_02375 [Massilia sp.]